ncbi:MAG TPA: hypothetical protein VLD86_06870, partial [Ilumatobacteraceae bacterium]|nr:hypothetical protein [Ilumatobacteraceae bacterium]
VLGDTGLFYNNLTHGRPARRTANRGSAEGPALDRVRRRTFLEDVHRHVARTFDSGRLSPANIRLMGGGV